MEFKGVLVYFIGCYNLISNVEKNFIVFLFLFLYFKKIIIIIWVILKSDLGFFF